MRGLPAMHRLLGDERVADYVAALGRDSVRETIEAVLDRIRASGDARPYDVIMEHVVIALETLRLKALKPVINATGIVVHTNLGRAPLPAQALAEIEALARGYCDLEYDLQTGERGSRYMHVGRLLRELTGAQDALVVNNCAAAVLLVLDTLAKGREVIVARSQLVEIGGGFRIPEVLERSGAALVEVGTTNRVYVEDFERALSARTALLLRTHPSNYRIEGFAHEVAGRDLAELGRRAGVAVVEDLGSGALVDLTIYGVERERTVQDAIADGIGLVTFSGDKLLGGPQAGIIVGRANLIAPLRNNPLLRALRVGKVTLAALAATLLLYRDPSKLDRIPVFRMLATPLEALRKRAEAYLDALPEATVVESDAYVGGGALPQTRIPSLAIALHAGDAGLLAASLRAATPAIVVRIDRDRVLLDLRTIAPEEDAPAIEALARATSSFTR
jgi:L-seryl-tRNA(Ser) seleniumtransferase